MDSVLLIALLLIGASIFGVIHQKNKGKIKTVAKTSQQIPIGSIGTELGDKATLLQFSSAFCAPCRATRTLLSQVVKDFPGIKHVEVDAEANLELVRELKVKSTPTTLILNSAGVEISRAVGAPRKSDVIATLNAIR